MRLVVNLKSEKQVEIKDFENVSYPNSNSGRTTITPENFDSLRIHKELYYFKGSTSAMVPGGEIEFIKIFGS